LAAVAAAGKELTNQVARAEFHRLAPTCRLRVVEEQPLTSKLELTFPMPTERTELVVLLDI
jgi:hypothetical protein